MRWSGEACHAGTAQQVGGVDEEAGDAVGPGMAEHVVVPARDADPGAVAGGARRGARCVHGTQLTPTLTLGRPRKRGVVGGRRVWRRCRAPARATPRRRRRPWRTRRSRPPGWRAACAPRAAPRRATARCRDRTAAIASATASNATRPSPRCSTTSSHHRSASGSPAAAANAPSGSTGAPSVERDLVERRRRRARPASVLASGRSIARTATPRALAHATACHSGLNEASGANAARCGWSTTWPSRATGGTSCSSPIHASAAVVSAGASTSTMSGCSSSNAVTTDRAEPGPWCRMPSRCTATALTRQPSARQAS